MGRLGLSLLYFGRNRPIRRLMEGTLKMFKKNKKSSPVSPFRTTFVIVLMFNILKIKIPKRKKKAFLASPKRKGPGACEFVEREAARIVFYFFRKHAT